MGRCGERPGGAGGEGRPAGSVRGTLGRLGARRASCVAEGGLGRGPVTGRRGSKGSADLSDPLLPSFAHRRQARSSVSANAITQVNV